MHGQAIVASMLCMGLMGGGARPGTIRGAQQGEAVGGNAAEPVGAAVGTAKGHPLHRRIQKVHLLNSPSRCTASICVGRRVQTDESSVWVGPLGVDEGPRFRTDVEHERVQSDRYEQPVRVGAILPESGVRYYEVPPEYKAHGYRYTVVNERPVLVEPATRRIVEIVE